RRDRDHGERSSAFSGPRRLPLRAGAAWRRRGARHGPNGSCGDGDGRASLPSSSSHPSVTFMRALVTGAAGFIGSTLSGHLSAKGATVTGLDCFTDYYPRPQKEANLAGLVGQNGFQFVESGIEKADLPRLLDGVTHVFHLAAQAGVRKSWGREFHTYTSNNL